jgi:hypothetical protein
VIAVGQRERAKALAQLLIADPRASGRSDIQPTCRVLTPDPIVTAGFTQTSGKWAARESNPEPWA